jgi:tRNA U34 2-thiouridine synthase MnmA/TrmU
LTHRAVALFSGGLDSTLAILAVLRQGAEVTALKFITPFDHEVSDRSSFFAGLYHTAEKFGFDVKTFEIPDQFLEIIKKPKFGYGRNMNPCIDCRILMLKAAKDFMEKTEADFIISGEVLGQRPMSQRKNILCLIDKEAGVTDYVLRPLSAKLLKITIPEIKGIINREMLFDFRGRSRKPQMTLAKDFGLTDYPAPAGGCLLTEPNYACRLKDLLAHNPDPDYDDLSLLRIGRHFRFSPSCKIIVGRNKAENEKIWSLSVKGCLLKVEGYGSPTTLIVGEITDEAVRVAASLCAKYSDAKGIREAEVTAIRKGTISTLRTAPCADEIIEALRIELKLLTPEITIPRGSKATA